MADNASILFEPFSIPLYRWQGEFSPQTRGPQAYAESKPIPLPSTIAGLLAGQFSAASNCVSGGDGEAVVEEVLRENLGDNFSLRGPYIYAVWRKKEGKKARVLCLMLGDERLYCVDVDNPTRSMKVEPLAIQHVGIALDSLSKSVMDGYMYTIRMADIYTTIAKLARVSQDYSVWGRLERFGVLVEVYGDVDAVKQLNNRIVWMGSRQKPYRVVVFDDTPAGNLAGRASRGEALMHIVSPIVFCGDERLNYSLEAGMEEKLYEQLLDKMGVKSPRRSQERICCRIEFAALGRGYDLCSDRKRPYCQAVMPGVQLRAELNVDPLKFYIEGTGSYRELGWGTILPLPTTLWACRDQKC